MYNNETRSVLIYHLSVNRNLSALCWLMSCLATQKASVLQRKYDVGNTLDTNQ